MSKSDKELATELTTTWLNHNASLLNPGLNGSAGGSKVNAINAHSVASAYLYFLKVIETGNLPKTDK